MLFWYHTQESYCEVIAQVNAQAYTLGVKNVQAKVQY